MKQLIKQSRIVLTAGLVIVGLSACASLDVFSGDETTTTTTSSESAQRGQDIWRSGHQYVSLVDKGRGSSQNNHPIALSSEDVKALLSSVSLSGGFIIKSDEEPVFSAGELQVLSAGLAQGLSEAQANVDVTFATVGLHSGAFDKDKKATAGRVFVRNGNLHIIFGLLHDEYIGTTADDEGNQQSTHLAAGIRLAEADLNSALALKPGQSFHRDPKTGDERDDWLVINMDTVLASRGLSGNISRNAVSNELLQDVEQSKKDADNIREDLSKMKEVLFELTDEVQRLRQELDALKQSR